MIAKQKREHFTYADYCEWDDDTRWELIDGVPYAMAAPTTKHQRLLGKLFRKFAEHLDDKECEVFIAPYDVRLNVDKADDTVVQPDLLVVCDSDKIGDKGCNGTPDLVIEILSPSTGKYDMMTKFAKYHKAGVREIWFVDPETHEAKIYKRQNDGYTVSIYGSKDKITVGILPELTIYMNEMFAIEEKEKSQHGN